MLLIPDHVCTLNPEQHMNTIEPHNFIAVRFNINSGDVKIQTLAITVKWFSMCSCACGAYEIMWEAIWLRPLSTTCTVRLRSCSSSFPQPAPNRRCPPGRSPAAERCPPYQAGPVLAVPAFPGPCHPGQPEGGTDGRTEGQEAAGTAGCSPSAWHARARAEPQGRSRPAPSPAARARPDWRGAVPITGRGARRPLALRGRAAPASARADPAPAAPLSAAAPLLAALSCLPPRAAGASPMREKRRRRWELLAGHPRRPASGNRAAAAPLLPYLPAARSRPWALPAAPPPDPSSYSCTHPLSVFPDPSS